jgi:ribose transport system substrate-binding protein
MTAHAHDSKGDAVRHINGNAGRRLFLAGLAAALTAGAAACSSGPAASSSAGPASSASSATASASGANLATAEAVVAPFTGHTGPFPVDVPLAKRPPAGSTYAMLQCATPVCAQLTELFGAAVHAIGANYTIVKAGPSVTQEQDAMSTIIADKPSGVIIPAIEPDAISHQLQQLHQAGVPVVSMGIVNAQQYGIDYDTGEHPSTSILEGQVLAAWAVLQKGAQTSPVFYVTPELSFGPFVEQGFDQEMAKLCPSCRVRNVDLPLADIGNSAPSLVVSDLQAHLSTNVAVFSTEEAATGLPAALKVAGLNVLTNGYGPPPAVLQYVKEGQITSGLAADLGLAAWTTVDALARIQTHQPLTAGETSAIPVMQLLTQKDMTFDLADGWSGYPNFPVRFATLWK